MRPFTSMTTVGLLLGLCCTGIAAPATLVFENRPREHNVGNSWGGMPLLRELPRQAAVVASGYHFNLPVVDRTIDFGADPADATHVDVLLSRDFRNRRFTLTVAAGNGDGPPLVTEHPPVPSFREFPHYAPFSPMMERAAAERWARLLAPNQQALTAVRFDQALDVPDEVEPLLRSVDLHDSFLAARLLHQIIAADGESPQRLAALVRAYSNLAESSRHLYSGHSSAFFARAMILADRLVRLAPDNPLSHSARGYVLALVGQPQDARQAFEEAKRHAGDTALPQWALLAEHLAHFQTRELFDAIDGEWAALSSHFALHSIEHAGLASIVNNLARIALELNPFSLRAIHVILDNTGVGPQHHATQQMAWAQLGLLVRLADDPHVPEPIQAAARNLQQQQEPRPQTVLELLAAMQNHHDDAAQLLPWRVYAQMQHDAMFVAAFRRLFFVKYMWSVDPSDEVAQWWPLMQTHRYASIIASFDTSGTIAGDDLFERLEATQFRDVPLVAYLLGEHAAKVTEGRPIASKTWIANQGKAPDGTTWDVARLLWQYRDADNIPFLSKLKAEYAKQMTELCPDHPSALAELILSDWKTTSARAAELEEQYGGHPQVAFALARAYRRDNRPDDAQRMLELTLPLAPERQVYEEMAQLQRDQGEQQEAIETLRKMIATTEDHGLDHAKASYNIALDLMRQGQFREALPHARRSADSFAAWGLRIYGDCLTELGDYAAAEQIMQAAQRRYPQSMFWYRWCQTTGRGDIDTARAEAMPVAHEALRNNARDPLLEAALFFLLEQDSDQALAALKRAMERQFDAFPALLIGLIHAEQGKREQALSMLIHATDSHGAFMGGRRQEIYRACAEELMRCLEARGNKELPKRDGEVKRHILDAAPEDAAYRANSCYFLGRLCEIRGDAEEAKWWYRQTMESLDWNASCRPLAAAGLRRLGEEFYR